MEKKLYKKHKYYSILSLDAWFNGNNRGKTGIYMALLTVIIGGAVSGIMEKLIGFETNYMAFVLFFIWIIVRDTIKSNSKLILSIPVGRKFSVVNRMIMLPLLIVKYAIIGLTCVAIIDICITMVIDESRLLNISGISVYDIKGLVLYVAIFIGTWMLLSISAFIRDNKKMIPVLIFTISAIIIGAYVTVHFITKGAEYRGTYNIKDLLLVGNDKLMFVCAIVYAGICTVVAYKINLRTSKVRRSNLSIPEMDSEPISGQPVLPLGHKKIWGVGIVLILVIAGLVVCFVTGWWKSDKNSIYYTEKISKYQEWNNIMELNNIPDYCVNDDDRCTILFPEEVSEDEVTKYVADFSGDYDIEDKGEEDWEGWYDFSWSRYLSVKLSDKEYTLEKQRIKDFTYDEIDAETEKVTGRKNHLVKDNTNFSYETYIATWDYQGDKYEYVMFDDENNSVIYVFASNEDLKSIKANYDIVPKDSFKVITIFNANTDNKGFFVKSFYNGKKRRYDE